jgi:hypothetical protein
VIQAGTGTRRLCYGSSIDEFRQTRSLRQILVSPQLMLRAVREEWRQSSRPYRLIDRSGLEARRYGRIE